MRESDSRGAPRSSLARSLVHENGCLCQMHRVRTRCADLLAAAPPNNLVAGACYLLIYQMGA